jgi:hypothetical protein
MLHGHRLLQRHFGMRPTIGWSLDPFGSSAANAVLYALMGFDALVINRIPDGDMAALRASKSLQFVWHPSPSLPYNRSNMFTHILDSYFCPPGPSTPSSLPLLHSLAYFLAALRGAFFIPHQVISSGRGHSLMVPPSTPLMPHSARSSLRMLSRTGSHGSALGTFWCLGDVTSCTKMPHQCL